MAIVDVAETYRRESSADDRRVVTYLRTFLVTTDDPRDGPIAARAAPGIAIGDPYSNAWGGQPATESDALSFCKAISAGCVADDGKRWEVRVDYGPFDIQQAAESPLDVPAEVSWSFAQWEEICDQDINGNAIVNTAGDPFDPPVTRENSLPVLTVTRNEATFDPALAYSYKDKINSDTFFGAAAGQVKVMQIEGRRQYHPAFGYYWQVNYQFQFDPRGFAKVILNQGLRQKVGSARKQILVDGAPVTSPVLLDSTGAPVAPGGTPVFLSFDVYESVAFSVFNLE